MEEMVTVVQREVMSLQRYEQEWVELQIDFVQPRNVIFLMVSDSHKHLSLGIPRYLGVFIRSATRKTGARGLRPWRGCARLHANLLCLLLSISILCGSTISLQCLTGGAAHLGGWSLVNLGPVWLRTGIGNRTSDGWEGGRQGGGLEPQWFTGRRWIKTQPGSWKEFVPFSGLGDLGLIWVFP